MQGSPQSAAQLAGPGGVVIGAIVMSFFANLLAAPLAARLDYRFLAGARLLAMLIGIAAGIGAVQAGGGLYGLVIRDALAAVALLIVCRLRAGPMASWRATRNSFCRLFRFAQGLWALNIAERLVLRLDYGAVGLLLGKEVLGAYFVVRGLVEGVLGFLVQPIQTVLFAHLCAAERGAGGAAALPARVVATLVLACLCLAIVSGLVVKYLVVWLLGADYAEASQILPAMAIYAGAVIWFELLKVHSMARLNHSRMVLARALQMSVFALLVIPSTRHLGVTGASIATAAGAVALAGFASRVTYGTSALANGIDSRTP
jgi:O-antigen/teichoic acid export membrane protein